MLKTFEVCNIKCEGCANTIKNSLESEGFTNIDIDLSCEPRKVTVDTIDEASEAHLKAILRNLGYPLCDEEIGFVGSTALKAKSFVSCAIGKISNNKKEN
jgi:copper chaperone CopZ